MSTDSFVPLAYPQVAPETLADRARGLAEGYAQGLRRAARENSRRDEELRARAEADARSASARLDAALEALGNAVASLDARLAPVIDEADRILAESAVRLAEAVLDQEISDGHADAVSAIRRILHSVPSGRLIAVHLNPQDLHTVQEAADRHVPDGVRLVADGTLSRGDATAELQHGLLDARIRAGVERAREVLTGR